MDVKCYLCDHEFVEGEEPWLIFEQQLSEDGAVRPSLAELLGTTLNLPRIVEQNAHSPYLCDSCNANIMEYQSLDRRRKEVYYRILGCYQQNNTIHHLNKNQIIETNYAEDAMVSADLSNVEDILHSSAINNADNVIVLPDDLNLDMIGSNGISDAEHVASLINFTTLEDALGNDTINSAKDINDCSSLQTSPKSDKQHVTVLPSSTNSDDMLENNDFWQYLIEEVGDEEEKSSALFDLNDNPLDFIALNTNALSEVHNLSECLLTTSDTSQKDLDSQNVDQEEDITKYIIYEEEDIQLDTPKVVMEIESDIDLKVVTSSYGSEEEKSIHNNYYSTLNTVTMMVKNKANELDVLINDTLEQKSTSKVGKTKDDLQSIYHQQFYTCDICNEGYVNETDLKEHRESNHAPSNLHSTCEVCLSSFTNQSLLRAHKRIHHSIKKPYECPVCRKNYNKKSNLNDHINTHTGERPFKCEECSKDFTSKYTLQNHMKIHTVRERPFKCDTCDKSFFNQQNLNQHKKLHMPYKEFTCDVCSKMFTTQNSLYIHKVAHSGLKPFICRICGKAFARRAEIKDHERIHTGEKPFKCDICPMAFSQRSNLTSHKKSRHYNEKLHHCGQCERSFKRNRLLQYHVLAAHTGQRPHKCGICGTGFVYPEHFKKHLIIHSGRKPYACEVCGRQFSSRDNRNAHRFVHSKKKPYECMECGAGFMRKPTLLAHMKRTKHINDKYITNQPQLTIQPEGGVAILNEGSNEENNAYFNKVDDTTTGDNF